MSQDAPRHPSSRDARISRRYECGEPIAAIAAEEGVDRKTVHNVARRAGLPLRHPPRDTRNARIVDRFRNGERVASIAEDEHVQRSYVSQLARRAGLPPRRGWQRKYPLREGAFDRPDAVGWWLIGLLAADGCVFPAENRVSLSQRAEDVDVLKAFYQYVGCPDRPLTPLTRTSEAPWSRSGAIYYEARIFSKHVCRALAAQGVVPRKSAALRLSDAAANEPAVWLGLFDGDGWGSAHAGRERRRVLAFYGAEPVMRQCAAFWAERLPLRAGAPAVRRHQGSLFVVRIYGRNASRAAKIMLSGSPVSLVRKRKMLTELAGSAELATKAD